MVKRDPPHVPTHASDPERRSQYIQENADWLRQRELDAAQKAAMRGERAWEDDFGVLSVVEAIKDVDFPTTREEMEAQIGDRVVNVSKRFKAPLREVLRKVGGGTFYSLSHFESTLVNNWVAVRTLERQHDPGAPRHGHAPHREGT